MARKEDQAREAEQANEGENPTIQDQADAVLSGQVYGQDAPDQDAQAKADADRASKSTDESTPARATKSAKN